MGLDKCNLREHYMITFQFLKEDLGLAAHSTSGVRDEEIINVKTNGVHFFNVICSAEHQYCYRYLPMYTCVDRWKTDRRGHQ